MNALTTSPIQRARRVVLLGAVALGLLLAWLGGTEGQGPASQPTPPEWASTEGWQVFVDSGCGKCHTLRGLGGGSASDLAALPPRTGFSDMAAAVWNHVPQMGARMWETGIERLLSGRRTSALLAFLFSARYLDVSGDAAAGERLFRDRGCARCHAVGGQGAPGAHPLDGLRKSNSAVSMAAAMWNHGLDVAERMHAGDVRRASLRPGELRDIVAHVMRVAHEISEATVPAVAETPGTGERVFTVHGCAGCHAADRRLGPGARPVSLERFAEIMWNHGPATWTAMSAARVDAHLTAQDMGGVVARLFASRYFDPSRGDGKRGRQLVVTKGCLRCHALNGRGATAASDLARSNVVGSVDGQIAAMWNHGRIMATGALRDRLPLRELSGQEFADITTYLAGLGQRPSP